MPRGGPPNRITILEDHELFAEALDVALTLERPQVVMLDLDLGPAGDGSRLVQPLRAAGAEVMIVSGTTELARLGECLCLGARTVVPKSAPLNVILARLRCVVGGLPAMPRHEREELIATATHRHRWTREMHDRLHSLSRREAEVLAELMTGHPVDDIARRSFVSVATVRTQVKAIRRKLGVSSQLAAVGLAQRAGWPSQTGPGPTDVPDLDDSSPQAG
jgi:two-component system nitrate/nitrite response regulator NarL